MAERRGAMDHHQEANSTGAAMLKWIGVVFLLLFLGLCTVAYLYSIALRQAGIIEGRLDLKMAAKDYSEHGYVTNYGASGYQVWLSSNVVSIGGTQYQCFITTTNREFYDEGALAMTTNQVFIWLDSKRAPKIIGTNYRAPLFPPRF
jgi:hypothetical protein